MAAIDVLHRSSYSTVFLGSPSVGAPLSCYKVYEKAVLQARHWLNISRECCILSRLQEARVHGVVQLISVADTPQHFSLQFKPCLGGNLYQAIERREFCDEAHLCTKVIIPLLRVLEQLHAIGIIHRDIKPENIFFEGDGCLVLGDFGLAIDSCTDKPCSRVGTHDYMAPEVMAQPSADIIALRGIPRNLLRPYSSAVDIWALGILVHEALTGRTPFCHADPAVVALKAQFAAPARLVSPASAECQAFVDAVLCKQPGKRPSAAVLLQHPWVQKHVAHALPAPKAIRYSCPLQRHISSDSTARTRSSNDSCSSSSSNSNSDASSSSGCSTSTVSTTADTSCCAAGTTSTANSTLAAGTAIAAGCSMPQNSPGSAAAAAPATLAGLQAINSAKVSSNSSAAYDFACPKQQQPASITAAAQRSTAFEQRAMTITLPNNGSACKIGGTTSNSSSAERTAVLQLVLVPALSAPSMLLEPHTAAPPATPKSGVCVSAAGGSALAGLGIQALAAAAAAAMPQATATIAAAAAAAEGSCKLRCGSWSPGVPAKCLATAAPAAAAATDAASSSKPAVAGAMGAYRVPAAGACAAVAAAAADASAAAAAAAATPSVKSLLSPVRSPLSLRRLRSSIAPAARGRCHSVELTVGSEGRAAAAAVAARAAAAAAPAASCIGHAAKPLPAACCTPSGKACSLLTAGSSTSREVSPLAMPCILLGKVPAGIVPSSLEQAAAPQQAAVPQQSPNKACRMMKGACKKMLHVLRHTQPGQAY